MRALGEQWIEDYGTVEHMVKAVKQEQPECCESSCDFCCFEHFHCNKARIAECNYGNNFIIKDLGIVNEQGTLRCPICGKYPTEITATSVLCSDNGHVVEAFGSGSKQANIDAWNRRD